MTNNYCSNCGAKISEQTKFCPECGVRSIQSHQKSKPILDSNEDDDLLNGKQKFSWIKMIVFASIIVVGAFLLVDISKESNSKPIIQSKNHAENYTTNKEKVNNLNQIKEKSQFTSPQKIVTLFYDGINLFDFKKQKGFEVYVTIDMLLDSTHTRFVDSSSFIKRKVEFFDSVIIYPQYQAIKFYKKVGPLSNDWNYIYNKVSTLIGQKEKYIRDNIADYNDKNLSNTIWQGRASLGRTWFYENYWIALDYDYQGIELHTFPNFED